ncbi:hypothetical protein [uncultured Xylophilus sp.]|uniref:hypothetical protein n=1 Tax=uncultured Xylophilus sp. TaxID=296832 RepID=UPI0025DF0D40|nr:hypothetical protein [uncultured Xylophilus sp.]
MDLFVPVLLTISSTSLLAVGYLALRLHIERQLRAEFAERVREQARRCAPDALRYEAFFAAGGPVVFRGEEFDTKAEADRAIDACLAGSLR